MLQDHQPVAYESRSLIPAERNYSPTELEMLAVVHCVKQWRCYIEGKEVHLYTDHKPNTTFASNPLLTRRQARWTEQLQEFNILWHYKPGPQNKVADALSRYPGDNPDNVRVLVAMTTAAATARSRHTRALPKDTALLQRIKDGYQHDAWFTDKNNTSTLVQIDGVYMMQNSVVVPDYDNLRTDLIAECHDTPYAGHVGRDKTIRLMQRLFWWPKLTSDVARYVKYCPSCQMVKPSNQLPAGLLHPLPVPGQPWESVSMDMVTDLPQTIKGFDSITVFVDRLTKMVHLAPSKKTDKASDVADLFIKEVFSRHGMPKQLVSDRGSVFTSNFWKEFMEQLQCKHAMSTAYHPQTDGNTERVNRVMEDMLRHLVMSDSSKWDIVLPMVEFAINNSHHDSIKTTPFMLNYGRNPNSPLSTVVSHLKKDKTLQLPEYVESLRQAQITAKIQLQAAQQRQKAYADRNRREVVHKVGDKVLLSTKNIKINMAGTSKLLPQYVGPFTVTAQVNPVAYRLELPARMNIHDVFHVSLLKPYLDDGRYQPPQAVMIDGTPEWQVHKVHGMRTRVTGTRSKRREWIEYHIEWTGYGPEHMTWEPASCCENCPEKIQEFLDAQRARQEAQVRPLKVAGRKRKLGK